MGVAVVVRLLGAEAALQSAGLPSLLVAAIQVLAIRAVKCGRICKVVYACLHSGRVGGLLEQVRKWVSSLCRYRVVGRPLFELG